MCLKPNLPSMAFNISINGHSFLPITNAKKFTVVLHFSFSQIPHPAGQLHPHSTSRSRLPLFLLLLVPTPPLLPLPPPVYSQHSSEGGIFIAINQIMSPSAQIPQMASHPLTVQAKGHTVIYEVLWHLAHTLSCLPLSNLGFDCSRLCPSHHTGTLLCWTMPSTLPPQD